MSLLEILAIPVRITLTVIVATYNFAATFLPFLPKIRPSITSGIHRSSSSHPSSRPASPELLASRFLIDFEESYGPVHPEFLPMGYASAVDKMKSELKFLLVYLHCEVHDNTESFCRLTLASQAFVDYLSAENVLVWAGDVRHSEAYQVSVGLSATTFPFLGLIALVNPPSGGTRPKLVKVIEGSVSSSDLISQLKAAIERHDLLMATLRAERAEMDSARRLRQQQDQAYAESLRRDQERESRLQEEREKEEREKQGKLQAIEKRKQLIEKRKLRRQRLQEQLPEEPQSGEVTRIQFRLPGGERKLRSFYLNDTVEVLYQFVETLDPLSLDTWDCNDDELEFPEGFEDDSQYDFTLVTPFPREEFTDLGKTIQEANLVNGNLIVEEK